MPRIFQKYVTTEGRSIVPPAFEPDFSDLPEKPDVPQKVGGSAVSLSDMMGSTIGKSEIGIEQAAPMMMVLVGIRNIIQSLGSLMKVDSSS